MGVFDGGVNHLIIPPQALSRTTQVFDAERRALEAEVAKAKAAVLGRARARGKLRRILRARLGRRGR
jgi:hypothetical protein